MQLHKILGKVAAVCFILGLGGLDGAITWGTGYITSGVLLIISGVSAYAAGRESGAIKKPRQSGNSGRGKGKKIETLQVHYSTEREQ